MQSLSGTCIANKALSKISNRLKFLFRNTFNFDIEIKRLLVFALIQCHYDYAVSSWYSGLNKSLKTKLSTSLNKVVRYTLGLHSRSHVGINEFLKVKFLYVESRVEQIKINHMFNILNNLAPSYLNATRVSDRHERDTRASLNSVVVPRVGTIGKGTFAYTAAKAWNALPNEIQTIQSKQLFKRRVKEFLFYRMSV